METDIKSNSKLSQTKKITIKTGFSPFRGTSSHLPNFEKLEKINTVKVTNIKLFDYFVVCRPVSHKSKLV